MTRGMSCFFVLSLLLAGTFAQDCNTVVETATEAGLSILLEAVEAADLVEAVNNPDGDLTIFAPTNEAFEAALAALGITAEDLLGNKEVLTEILTYHVLPKARKAADFGEGGSFVTLLGDNSSCDKGDVVVKPTAEGVIIEGGASSAKVVAADVEACTTTIHVIDSVLLPCALGGSEEEAVEEEKKCTTVVEAATSAGLTTLLAAVTEAGLDETVNNPDAGLTIFAPTDKAFARALEALGLTAEELLADKETLTSILQYHVLAEPLSAKALLKKEKVDTLLQEEAKCPNGDARGTDLTVRKRFFFFGPVMVKGKGSIAKVEAANVEACSTIIHVIDFVLLPCKPSCTSKTCRKAIFGRRQHG